MNILVTGAKGFIGRNLVESLKNIKNRTDPTRPGIRIDKVFEFDMDDSLQTLDTYCREADFVFHLAGVNRPEKDSAFMEGNCGSAEKLLDRLEAHHNRCPVMLSSSIQASLEGRYAGSEYGRSKRAGEDLFFRYGREHGVKVLVYRFPNVFGKWCRPDYNSAVATFCDAVANGRGYTVNNREIRLELLYIDDLVSELLDALEGREHRCQYDGTVPGADDAGGFCHVPVTHHVTLGEIADMLERFKQVPQTLQMPDMPEGSFEKKLYSTYLSYLPQGSVAYGLAMHEDQRGAFTELFRTPSCGQASINITRPGNARGQHWHHSKWEVFVVVSGHGLIRERRIGTDPQTGQPFPVMEFEVTGGRMQAVQMLPGYTHEIINLSHTEDLVTVIWANEPFDPGHPDTFYEPVAAEGDIPANGEVFQIHRRSRAYTDDKSGRS